MRIFLDLNKFILASKVLMEPFFFTSIFFIFSFIRVTSQTLFLQTAFCVVTDF